MKILALFFLISVRVQAAQVIHLQNSWNLFTQKLGPGFTLPEPLSNRAKLAIQFELPDSGKTALKKVYSQVTTVDEYKTVFEIYFFEQNALKYLSQQIFLYKSGNLVTRCTSYFGLEQKFLVPGSCAGVESGSLYGVAIYK